MTTTANIGLETLFILKIAKQKKAVHALINIHAIYVKSQSIKHTIKSLAASHKLALKEFSRFFIALNITDKDKDFRPENRKCKQYHLFGSLFN